MPNRIQVKPDQAAREFAEFHRKLMSGAELLSRIKDDDVQIATTPKRAVFQQDNRLRTRHCFEEITRKLIHALAR